MKNSVLVFNVILKTLLYSCTTVLSIFAALSLVNGFMYGELILGMILFSTSYVIVRFLSWIGRTVRIEVPFERAAKGLQLSLLLIVIAAYVIPGMNNGELYKQNRAYLNEACGIDNRVMVLINSTPGIFSDELLHVAINEDYVNNRVPYLTFSLCVLSYGYVSTMASAVKITKIEEEGDS